MSMKCDLCQALDNGGPQPSAPRMHEIEQNDCSLPYINYSPYAPSRQTHSEHKKNLFLD